MTDQKLKLLVWKAVKLDRLKAKLLDQLDEVKSQLITEAESRKESHFETDGGGSSCRFEGSGGCSATISFPAPSLRGSMDSTSKPFQKIMAMIDTTQLEMLFKARVSYEPMENFREITEDILGKNAGKLIKLCEFKSRPRVSFETKFLNVMPERSQ